MVETNPFGVYVPKGAKYLFLGTFAGKITDKSYDWFFGSKRSQFWKILEEVYGTSLKTKNEKQALFSRLKLAITDTILSCERSEGNNADTNLINIVYNSKEIGKILKENKIEKIYFSSGMAETLFKKVLKELGQKYNEAETIRLPSPSPRNARMTKVAKIERYRLLMPKLTGI